MIHSCAEILEQTLPQYWERDVHISAVQYLGSYILFPELVQSEPEFRGVLVSNL